MFLLDPLVNTPQKALEEIGSRLQEQYERWQPRVCVFKPRLTKHYRITNEKSQ